MSPQRQLMTGSPQRGQISCGLNTCPPTALPRPARVLCRGEKNIRRTLCSDGRDGWRRSCTYRIPRQSHRRVRSGCGPVELRSLDMGRRNRLGASASQKVNPYSMIQDWKLTLVVAASPYVGHRVEDEELLRSIVRWLVWHLFPENGFTWAVGPEVHICDLWSALYKLSNTTRTVNVRTSEKLILTGFASQRAFG